MARLSVMRASWRAKSALAPGTAVKLDLIHDGQEKTVTLTLGALS
jgi:S1-C subfamily serine protease